MSLFSTLRNLVLMMLPPFMLFACSQQAEVIDKRGSSFQVADDNVGPGESPGEANQKPENPASNEIQALSQGLQLNFNSQVNFSALSDTFEDSLLHVAKIDNQTTVFYGTNSESWILKEGKSFDELDRISPGFLRTEGTDLYVLPDDFFWLVDRQQKTLQYPDLSAENDPGQQTTISISPKFLADDEAPAKLLFASKETIMFTDGKSISGFFPEGTTVITVDLPDIDGEPFVPLTGGFTNQKQRYWLIGSNGMVFMNIGESGEVKWQKAKTEIAIPEGVKVSDLRSLALFVEFSGDNDFKVAGYSFFQLEGQVRHDKDLNLVPSFGAEFNSTVKPLLEAAACMNCHAVDYTDYETVRKNAASVEARITSTDPNLVMPPPPNPVMPEADRQEVVTWLQKAVIPELPENE